MHRPSDKPSGACVLLKQRWQQVLRAILPFSIAFGALLLVENIAVARIDRWLPIETFEAAAQYSLYVSAVALWFRLCIVGAGIAYVLKSINSDISPSPPRGFLGFWCAVCLVLVLSLLALDYWIFVIQFGDPPWGDVSMRWFWLATLYIRILLYFVAVRLLLGALHVASNPITDAAAAWSATTAVQSIGWFFALLVLKLFVDSVVVNLISFAPVISPFWFVPNELSPMRHVIGQGIDIAAQSCGVFLYVAFWIVAYHRILPHRSGGSAGDRPAMS